MLLHYDYCCLKYEDLNKTRKVLKCKYSSLKMLIHVEYIQMLSSLRITNSTMEKCAKSCNDKPNKNTPRGSQEQLQPLNEVFKIHLQTKANDSNTPHSLANEQLFHKIIFP